MEVKDLDVDFTVTAKTDLNIWYVNTIVVLTKTILTTESGKIKQ